MSYLLHSCSPVASLDFAGTEMSGLLAGRNTGAILLEPQRFSRALRLRDLSVLDGNLCLGDDVKVLRHQGGQFLPVVSEVI